MRKKLITAQSESLILGQLDTIKTWLKIDIEDNNEDDLILFLLKSALNQVLDITGIACFAQTWENYFDEFPCGEYNELVLYPFNATAVTSVKYYDTVNTLQTWASTNYEVDLYALPVTIEAGYYFYYPTTYPRKDAITVKFNCGYASWDLIPEQLRLAMQMMISHWYENRQDVVIGRTVSEIPQTSEFLLQPYKIRML